MIYHAHNFTKYASLRVWTHQIPKFTGKNPKFIIGFEPLQIVPAGPTLEQQDLHPSQLHWPRRNQEAIHPLGMLANQPTQLPPKVSPTRPAGADGECCKVRDPAWPGPGSWAEGIWKTGCGKRKHSCGTPYLWIQIIVETAWKQPQHYMIQPISA